MITGSLSTHILHYCAERLADDDVEALFELGFTVDEINTLDGIALQQLHHLNRLGDHFLTVTIDHRRLAHALEHIQHEAEHQALQDKLLRWRAPAPMMRALFGMRASDYAKRRKRLGLSGRDVGRPAIPDEATERRVWAVWREHSQLTDSERYLQVAEVTKLPLNVVWAVVQAEQPAASRRQNRSQSAGSYPKGSTQDAYSLVASARASS